MTRWKPFGARFWQCASFPAGNSTRLLKLWGNGRFGPNPDRQPFGARFWQFAGFPARNETRLLRLLANGRFRPNPGREPFGARFWQLAGVWKPMGSFWEASGKLPETAVPLCQARSGRRTPRHKRFSGNDFPGRARRAGRQFWSRGALFLLF